MFYLAEAASARESAALSTLRGWMAAINRVHLEAGHRPPGDDTAMTMFLRGLSRTTSTRVQQRPISALRIQELRVVCRHLDALATTPLQLRDRALLLLQSQGILPGELSRLQWSDITFDAHRATLTLQPIRSVSRGRTLTLADARRSERAALEALQRWRDVATTDPSFISPRSTSTATATANRCCPSRSAGPCLQTVIARATWYTRHPGAGRRRAGG